MSDNLQLPYKYNGHHSPDGHRVEMVIIVKMDIRVVMVVMVMIIIVVMVGMVVIAIMVIMIIMVIMVEDHHQRQVTRGQTGWTLDSSYI